MRKRNQKRKEKERFQEKSAGPRVLLELTTGTLSEQLQLNCDRKEYKNSQNMYEAPPQDGMERAARNM
jgi:hypothetical protein